MENRDLTPIPLSAAARLLAVSQRTVRRLVDRGDLPATRLGSQLVIRRESLPGPLSVPARGDDLEPLLTLHDAASRLGCAPRRIRQLTSEGKLRTYRVGGSTRWAADDVEALVAPKPRLHARGSAAGKC